MTLITSSFCSSEFNKVKWSVGIEKAMELRVEGDKMVVVSTQELGVLLTMQASVYTLLYV
jgi:hypothetical protein